MKTKILKIKTIKEKRRRRKIHIYIYLYSDIYEPFGGENFKILVIIFILLFFAKTEMPSFFVLVNFKNTVFYQKSMVNISESMRVL